MEKKCEFQHHLYVFIEKSLALDFKNGLWVQMEYHEPLPPLEAWVTIHWVSILKYFWNMFS